MSRLGQGVYRAGQTAASATEDESALDSMVRQFLEKVKMFYANLRGLQAQKSFVEQHPELQGQYAELLERGSFIDNQIKNAKALMEKARGWWQWALDMVGLGSMDDLEALPVIAVAIGAGAAVVALISKWLTDAFIFSRKIEAIKALEAKGSITGGTAARIITQAGPGSILDKIRGNLIWVVIGGTILLLGPDIMKLIAKRR